MNQPERSNPEIPSYTNLEQLFEVSGCKIFRAQQKQDDKSVLIKWQGRRSQLQWFESLLHHEYEVSRELTVSGIIQPIHLIKENKFLALIMKDVSEGEFLQTIESEQQIDFKISLDLMVQLANILHNLHQSRIIHKDIRPANMLVDISNWTLHLTGFGMASTHLQNKPIFSSSLAYLDHLAYISPEQTGRMNCDVDYRTDLYSLGITLYQLLTGQLPFNRSERLALIHEHLAMRPRSVCELCPDIPESVAAIVDKLLEKQPEDRYQSAAGLGSDLQLCANQWRKSGTVIDFQLAKNDVFEQLLIPSKLFGREHEINLLEQSFNKVTKGGIELVLISGPAGIGKSTLVREVFKSITAQSGLFIASMFFDSEFKAPYSAWIKAFRYHLLNLISQGTTEIEYWRGCLFDELGDEVYFLFDLIPELEQIVGPQDRVANHLTETPTIWFTTLLVKFIRAFCRSKHPLTIFLDDMQWADNASLELISFLASSVNCCPGCQHLLIVCAYRETKATNIHPLSLMLDTVNLNPVKIQVAPLAVTAINDWIMKIFHNPSATTQAMAELLYQKTEGNPLFIKEILNSLHKQDVFTFDNVSGTWQWNLGQIDLAVKQLDLEEVFSQNVELLNNKTKQIIQLAACIGTYFNLPILTELSEYTLDQVQSALDEAIEHGIIIQLDISNTIMESSVGMTHLIYQDYRFIHTLIHQSVNQSMDDEIRSANHEKIGLKWLDTINDRFNNQPVFECANQLNRCLNRQNSEKQRISLAQLNLNAGLLAESTQAFSTALTFFNQALDIINEEGWIKHYPLMLQLTTLSARSALQTKNYDLLEMRYQQISKNAKDIVDKSAIQQIKIKAFIAQYDYQAAIDFMLHAVRELGIKITIQPGSKSFWLNKLRINRLSTSHHLQNFSERQLINNPKQLAYMKLLCTSLKASFNSMPKLFSYSLQKLTLLSFEQGNNPVAATAFIGYGGLCCEQFDDVEGGLAIAQAGTKILDTSTTEQENEVISKLMFCCFVVPWKHPLPDCLPLLEQVLERALSLGETNCAEWALQTLENYMYFAGFELSKVSAKIKAYDILMHNVKYKYDDTFNQVLHQTLSILTNRSPNACNRNTIQSAFFGQVDAKNDQREDSHLFFLHFHKAIIGYLFGHFDDASINLESAYKHQTFALLGAYAILINFYDSLIRIAFLTHLSQQDKKRWIHKIVVNQQKMKNWSKFSPYTCQHKYLLIRAELASLEDKQLQAGKYYEDAIEAVQKTNNLLETALVWELAARFNIRTSRKSTGKVFLEKAYMSYTQWGGWAKIHHLNQTYPEQAVAHDMENLSYNLFSNNPENTNTDSLKNAIKAIEILSNATDTKTLCDSWINLISELSVAQKTVLIVKQSGKFLVIAESLGDGSVISDLYEPIESYAIPTSIVSESIRTGQLISLNNQAELNQFVQDPYFEHHIVNSVLCIPVVDKNESVCLVYIENSLRHNSFSQSNTELLNLHLSLGWYTFKNAHLADCLQTELSNIVAERKNFKATEAHLRESKNHTLAILETSLDAVISIDAEGLVIDWSAKAETIFGWKSKETIGNLLANLIIPVEHRDAHKKGMERFLLTGQGKVVNKRIEITGLKSDGTKIPVELAIAPIFSDGKYTFSAFIRDLTEQKDIEAELNQQREALYQSEKLSSLGILLAGVSHELNNPLSVVVGRSMMLQAEVDDEKTVKTLEIIKKSAERCSKIVKSFLAIARQQEPNYELVHINDLLHEAVDLIAYGLLSDGVECIFDLQMNLPNLSGDIDQLRQVFSNIIINSHQALQHINGPRQIQFITRAIQNTEIEISISDNGLGVPEEIKNRIFDPFYTSKPVGEGTGFGLSYSRGVVESHAGKLQLESPAEGGARFVIKLPLDHFEIQSKVLNNVTIQTVKTPFSLLIIDDELAVAEMLSDRLKKEGHEVSIAENGVEALKICLSKTFELIICDLHMPKMDGISFSKQLIQRKPTMGNRIIFITGDSLGIMNSNDLKKTSHRVIEKPIIPDDFAKLINKILFDLEVEQ